MNLYKYQFLPSSAQTLFLKVIKLYRSLFFRRHNKNLDVHYFRYILSSIPGTQKKICYAPFQSIYLGLDGNAHACCLNRTHVLGNFQEHNINEIWNGDKINELRTSLSQNILKMGCDRCKNMIESGNYDAVEAMKFDVFPQKKQIYELV